MVIKQTETYKKWEDKLRDKRAKTIIATRVARLANGLAGDVKSVGEKVMEIRIKHGPGYRVYYTERNGELVLLLCGGDKSSQSRDILAAKQLAKEYKDG